MKFKSYLKEASKKDILKRFKKLKKKRRNDLLEIVGSTYDNFKDADIIRVILLEEFREEDVEFAFEES